MKMEPWGIDDKPGPGTGLGNGELVKESAAGNTPQKLELPLEKAPAPTPEEKASFYAQYILPVGRFTRTKIAPAAGATLKYGAKATGKVVRQVSPFIPAGAVFLTYNHFGDDIAEFVDQYIPGIGVRLDDPARGLGQTAENLDQLTANMPIEEQLGNIRPEYDAVGEVEQVRTILSAVDRDYNTIDANLERVTYAIVEHTTTFSVRVGDALIIPIEATAEMVHLDGILNGLRDVNDFATYNAVYSYLEQQLRTRINEEMNNHDHSLQEALWIVINERRNDLEFEQRMEVTNREGQRCIEDFMNYLHSIGDTHELQMDTAELVEGYGNVVEAALTEYQRTRNPEALTQIGQYVQSQEAFQRLEADTEKYIKQHQQVSELLNQLEGLTANVQDRRATLEGLQEIYFALGNLRTEYQTVGQRFAPEQQNEAIARIDGELERLDQQTDEAVDIARHDPEYLAVNPVPREPSNLAYVITDGAGLGLTAALALVGAKNYVGRGFRAIFKKNKNE